MMIQNYSSFETNSREQIQLTQQIQQYRRINASLKKKIQARDKKINYLFSCLEQLPKSAIRSTIDGDSMKRNSSDLEFSLGSKKELPQTDPRKREKQNVNNSNINIFKAVSNLDKMQVNENLRLPYLDKKNIFIDGSLSNNHSQVSAYRPKVIKISREKLIPLRAEDIKKKFENKFHKEAPSK